MKKLFAIVGWLIGATVLWTLIQETNINIWWLGALLVALTTVTIAFVFPSDFKFKKEQEPKKEPNWILRIIIIYIIGIIVIVVLDLQETELAQMYVIPAKIVVEFIKIVIEYWNSP